MEEAGKGCRIDYIRAEDGVAIPVRVFAGEGGGIPVIMIHGLRSHSGWFIQSGDFLASLCCPVYAFDRRGSGLSRETRGHATSFWQIVDDLLTIAAFAMDRHSTERVHVLGHCFGAIPAAIFACRYPDKVESLILPTPGIYTLADLSLIRKLQIMSSRFIGSTRYIPFLLEPEMLADLEDSRRFIMDDSLSLTSLTAGFCFETFRAGLFLRNNIRRLTVPVFMALAGKDKISDNAGNKAFFDKIPSEYKKLVIYPDAVHILEFSIARDVFFSDVADWLRSFALDGGQKA